MMSSELKPCPFCGGVAILGTWRDEYRRLNPSAVHCSVCHVETKIYDRKKEAIEAWNSRTENEEMKFTRAFIHEHGLEFALAEAWKRRGEG